MLRTSGLILFFIVSITVSSHAQSRRDNLQQQLDSLEQVLGEAEPEKKVQLFMDLSEIYWQHSYDTSLLMAKHALTLAEEIEDQVLLAAALNTMGIAYYLMGDYHNALEYYLEALGENQELGDSSSIGIIYNNLGAIYLDLKDNVNALSYFKDARDIFKIIGDDTYTFSILNNMGTAYIDFEQYDTAYMYLLDAYEFAQGKNNLVDVTYALTNLGQVAMSMGLLTKSEDYLKESIEISRSLGDKSMLASTLDGLGELYLEMERYQEAYPYLLEALDYAEEVHSLPDKKEIYKALSSYHETLEDYKEALKYMKLHASTRDSILTQEGLARIKELDVSSRANHLLAAIQSLRLQNEINKLNQARMKFLIFFLLAIAILGITLILINYQKNRLKRDSGRLLEEKNLQLERANRKLKESEKHLRELNQTKDKFFSIIGHDLRNPLNALLGFSELISGNSREYTFEEIQKYSNLINEAAKNIHLLIENLLEWSRSQSGNIEYSPSKQHIYPVVEEIIKIFSIQAEEKRIDIDVGVSPETEAYFDRNLVSTIIRNLVNNAIKFTPKGGKVGITSQEAPRELIISVKDTGIGMTGEQTDQLFLLNGTLRSAGTSEERGTGLGLILCREFIDMHGGRIWVESEPGKGSTFHFTLPGRTQ